MMIYSYPGCFFQRPDGSFCVVFVDLNNLAAFGNSFDTVLANAVDLLSKYIYNIIIRNGEVPEPSDIETLRPDVGSEYTRAFLRTVNVDVEEYAKKHFESDIVRTVTIPAWMDDIIKKDNIDLSEFVKRSFEEKYNIKKP
ncbi:MAG: type II toxin-antitoxin system HicB family antitoxin [Oscillospiraceae bacterium]|nr:type II toxin-antitoxin system HicB family antitoxin [Oscillospiraceae bacterium]